MPCDLCGKEAPLLNTQIEGSELQVCQDCSSHGKVLSRVSQKPEFKRKILPKFVKEESIEIVIPNAASLIKSKRESLNISQENFAKKINEKASLLSHIESGKTKPSIELAKKLEKALNITLVEQDKISPIQNTQTKSEGLTIGDLIKVR
tara:strand:+ start:1249 stop:1695 length:447 start_codon:yes stop_codon:yes gene_type:complete